MPRTRRSHALFGYTIILQPAEDGDDAVLLAGPGQPVYVLAKDASEVKIIANRAIPDEHMGQLDRITIDVWRVMED